MASHEFRASCFERRAHLFRAVLNRAVMNWADLDEVLDRVEPDAATFQLFRDGDVPLDAYSEQVKVLGRTRRRLHKIRFYSLMRNGASLVINRFEDHSPLAQGLCAEVGRYTSLPTTSNAYVSFGGQGTFGKHWDTHDVFALQLLGRKRWRVFAPSFPLPLSQHTSQAAAKDCGPEPLLDCILEAGDMLYLPRGWWHEVVPLGAGSLHLSIGAYAQTNVDFIQWVCTHYLPQVQFARQAFQGSSSERSDFVALAKQLETLLTDPATYRRFEQDLAARERPSSKFNLPLFADVAHGLLAGRSQITLASHQAPAIVAGELLMNGTQLRLDALSIAVIDALKKQGSLTLDALQTAVGATSREAMHRTLLNLAGLELVSIQ
jgi:ribosomal protein L16 Arg81 hydroxylase